MVRISVDDVTGQLLGVLDETFIYKEKSWTYFTDNKPDAGLVGLLSKINAADASRTSGGSSIAAHVHHLIFSLAASSDAIRGDRTPRDWKESWNVTTVDEATWSNLREELRTGYQRLRQTIESDATSTVESMGEAVAVIAHAAFHLGAIRQKHLFA